MSAQTLVERLRALHDKHQYVTTGNSTNYGEAADRIEALEAAITKTLNENGHLADGENCTLIELKRVMGDRS